MTGHSIALFCIAALAEIGGAYLIWAGLREGKGPVAVAAGAIALVIYGLLAARQPSSEFGRVLAAYGGVFVIGSLLWAVVTGAAAYVDHSVALARSRYADDNLCRGKQLPRGSLVAAQAPVH